MVRKKRVVIGKDQRMQWLGKFERGATAAMIAQQENVDIRTARTQIEKARGERLAEAVQRDLLTTVLKKHHEELIEYLRQARELLSDWNNREVLFNSRENPIATVLKEHIPKSSIWDDLNKWNKALENYDEIKDEVYELVEKKARELKLPFVVGLGKSGLQNVARDTVMEELCRWVQGSEELRTKTQTISKEWGRGSASRDKDTVIVGRQIPSKLSETFGVGFAVGYASPGKEGELEKKYLTVLETVEEAFQGEKLEKLKKVLLERDKIQESLQGELDILILKGMVPGHCRACPI